MFRVIFTQFQAQLKMQHLKIYLITLLFSLLSFNAGSAPPPNFSVAKKLAASIFNEHPKTLYCNCSYDRFKKIDLKSCGMQEARRFKRAHRVEWEHMMPAENFGRQFRCWREKICRKKSGKTYRGRKCCQRINPQFRRAEGELYNLWPSVGLVNQARSNYRFSPLPAKNGFFGCNMEIDKNNRKVDPNTIARGIVARANLFMADKYKVRLSDSQRKLFNAWNKQYPPTTWEKKWAASVAKIEGYKNIYITGD